MKLASRLRFEKTLRAKKIQVTLNAAAVYVPPYGRGLIKIGGRGASGNPSTGGNYANTNPASGGNYAGTYNPQPGNISGYNPDTAGTTYTVPGNTNPSTTNPDSYTPGNYVPTSTQEITIAPDATCPTGWYETWYSQADNAEIFHDCILTTNAYTNPDTYTPGNTVPGNTNPSTTYTNSYTPGNANYNPTIAGYAYYNPYVAGNANYNPVIPGNPGSPTIIGGVTFPGGPIGALAQVIAPTPSTIEYSANGYYVTVAPGGYVTITPI